MLIKLMPRLTPHSDVISNTHSSLELSSIISKIHDWIINDGSVIKIS
jgi:hypothetical protein